MPAADGVAVFTLVLCKRLGVALWCVQVHNVLGRSVCGGVCAVCIELCSVCGARGGQHLMYVCVCVSGCNKAGLRGHVRWQDVEV